MALGIVIVVLVFRVKEMEIPLDHFDKERGMVVNYVENIDLPNFRQVGYNVIIEDLVN